MKNVKKRKIAGISVGSFLIVFALIWLCQAVTKNVAVMNTQDGEKDSFVIYNLKVCHVQNPIGIDEETPVFSWCMESEKRGAAQSAYRILVADGRENLDGGQFLWDSGKIIDSVSAGILYEGERLEPRKRYFWRVEVWNEDNQSYVSGEEAWFETGLMGEGMPGAKWISAEQEKIDEAVDEEALAYAINYQMEVDGTTAGFVFGAGQGRYGDLYLCEIKNQQEEVCFRLKHMDGGTFLSEEEVDISHCIPAGEILFDVRIMVEKEKAEVIINGTQAGEFVIEPTPVESIGYYKSRGVSYAWIDDISVCAGTGEMIYEEDFEDEDTIFAPYHVAVESGRLKVGSGLMLTGGFEEPAPLFRREFILQDKEVDSARVYMTALGSFALSINGERVSEDYFSPGKLAYNRQLSYVTYDVTELLRKGENNAMGIILLHGWYDRAVGYPEIWNPWGDKNALLGKLVIEYEDGSVEEVVTDEEFLYCLDGPVRTDDLYQGEFYDANCEKEGFDTAGFSEEGWQQAEENAVREEYLSIPLVGKKNESIACVEVLTPVSVSEPEENILVYDFGQNFAGTCRIKVKGDAGKVITLRYGEAVNEEELKNKDDEVGTIWTENLFTAEATDYYVLKGDDKGEIFEPEFVFHGFRYLQVSGIGEGISIEDVEGLVLSSDLEQTGSFSCSNKMLNRYYQNTIWSQRSNFMDNPMDCPQRDERHGWAGDAQIFSLTASYHMDTYNFYEKYLRELRLLQSEGGSFTDMAPRNFGTDWDGTGGASANNCWGDAAVVITWNLYTQYGDKIILRENYEALCSWVDMLAATSEDYIRDWGGYGDHLSLEDTPSDLSDTAWCAHAADLLSRMAKVLGEEEDAVYYEQIYEEFRKAWQGRYILSDGTTTCDTQTSYVLGLAFSLFPEELEGAAAERLHLLAQYSDYHIKTGYSGIGYLLPVLSHNGMKETAYEMLQNEEGPSLLYAVAQGATTTWESFFAYQEEEGGYRLDGSLNHYAYGTPAGWLYTDVLGIQSDEADPGFKHILLEPLTGGGLSFAEGSYTSTYGKISVEWKETETGYEYRFEIPANTTATLSLPSSENMYFVDEKPAEDADGVVFLERDEEKVKYELVSGTYCFVSK
ncbi:MAG: family 78 glycoside hydrolase catalytic domain [Lachnospiraceae bacterium]|nr:family 78 glycoside hydrolase catalytic domain [Lachnospiraceae bacterium]